MNAISRGIQVFEQVTLTLSILFSIAISIAGVFFRYVIGSSLSFVEEVAGYMLLTIISVGIGAAVRQKSHLRVDILIQYLPKTKKLFNILADLLALGVMTILIIYAIGFVSDLLISDQRATSMYWLPLGLPLLIMPIGYLTAFFRLIESFINLWKNDNEPKSEIN
jgi:TRAP-type C4-dicarboxylate transport system permease small subunit